MGSKHRGPYTISVEEVGVVNAGQVKRQNTKLRESEGAETTDKTGAAVRPEAGVGSIRFAYKHDPIPSRAKVRWLWNKRTPSCPGC